MSYFYNVKNYNKLKYNIYEPVFFSDNYTKYYSRVILSFNQSILDNYDFSIFNQINLKEVGYSFIINNSLYLNNLNKTIKFKYLNYLNVSKDYLENFYKLLNLSQKTFIIVKPKRGGLKVYNSGIIGFFSKIELKYLLRLLSNIKMFSIFRNKFLIIQFSANFLQLNIKIHLLKKYKKRKIRKKRYTSSLNFLFSLVETNF